MVVRYREKEIRMKKLSLFSTTILFTIFLVMGYATNGVHAQAAPKINLSPTSGFATITISGSGFYSGPINILWDGNTVLSTIPSPIWGGDNGEFTAIISVPTPTEPGFHKVTATDGYEEASAFFDVLDMTGPQGIRGPEGPAGEAGTNGINCWDLNGDGIANPSEDTNGDGVVDVLDCKGPQGETGPPGESTVIEGAQGSPGEQGPPGRDGLSIIWRGEWSPDAKYTLNNAVSYEGNVYIATVQSQNAKPTESPDQWDLMVPKGVKGDTGEQGKAGGGGSVGTTGFFLALAALILIAASKVKKWIFG